MPFRTQPTNENAHTRQRVGRSIGTTQKEHPVSSTQAAQKTITFALPSRFAAPTAAGLLEEGRFVVTPGIATQLLERFNYVGQRRIEKQHVSRLAVQMRSGVWTPGSQIAFGSLPNGTVCLVNGQHRLQAVIASGVPVEFQLLVVPVENEAGLHALYYRFDTVQRERSGRMVLASIGIAEQLDISRDAAHGAYRAGVVIASGLKMPEGHGDPLTPELGTPDGRLAAIEPWWPQVKQYNDAISPAATKIKRRLLIASVMPVALVTLKYQPAKALEFWSGVAADDGLHVGDARKAMVHVLANVDFKNGFNAGLIYTANCWNAWYAGRPLRFTKMVAGSVCAPAGTPFAAKRK